MCKHQLWLDSPFEVQLQFRTSTIYFQLAICSGRTFNEFPEKLWSFILIISHPWHEVSLYTVWISDTYLDMIFIVKASAII